MDPNEPISCFWLEPLEIGRSSLRRYERFAFGRARASYPMPKPSCPDSQLGRHDSWVSIGTVPFPLDSQGLLGYCDDEIPHDDPHWPKVCATCGAPFTVEDKWEHNVERLFKGSPDGVLRTARNMLPGSMYDAKWVDHPGKDGVTLAVVLPGGVSCADVWYPDYAGKGPAYERTGKIPRVTCKPSVQTPNGEWVLADGKLFQCRRNSKRE